LTYLGFVTEGKLVAIFFTPYFGVPNWPVIYIINHMATVFWHHSTPHHQRSKNRDGEQQEREFELGCRDFSGERKNWG
jgi:hypothetical protein